MGDKIKTNKITNENKIKNNFIDNSSDYLQDNGTLFNLGLIILNIALGGYNFDSFNSKETIELLKNKKKDYCCYLHLLLSSESKQKHKNTVRNYLTVMKYSDYFIDFLCKALNFQNKYDIKSLLSTSFIKYIDTSKKSSIKVSVKELIKITKESKRCSRVNQTNDKKILNFFLNLEIILTNNKTINKAEITQQLKTKTKILKELSFDLGMNLNDLINKMQNFALK